MDKILEEALRLEKKRQDENIELIASENYVMMLENYREVF